MVLNIIFAQNVILFSYYRVSSRGGGRGGEVSPPNCPTSPPKEKEKEREKGEREREGNGREVGGAYIWVL